MQISVCLMRSDVGVDVVNKLAGAAAAAPVSSGIIESGNN